MYRSRTDRSADSDEKRTQRRHRLTHRLTEADRARLVEAYASGTPATQLARQFGIRKGSVLKILDDAGVVRRVHSPTDEQVVEATRLYREEQWSLQRIAEHFGFRAGTIHRHLKRRGVPTRRPWDYLLG